MVLKQKVTSMTPFEIKSHVPSTVFRPFYGILGAKKTRRAFFETPFTYIESCKVNEGYLQKKIPPFRFSTNEEDSVYNVCMFLMVICTPEINCSKTMLICTPEIDCSKTDYLKYIIIHLCKLYK